MKHKFVKNIFIFLHSSRSSWCYHGISIPVTSVSVMDPPLMPNGIIIAYEISYRPTASSESETRVNTTAMVTHFTTEDNLEEDTEFFFSVRAYTRVGPGNTSSLTVSTLAKSSKVLQ